MIEIIAIMSAGIILGYLFRCKKKLIQVIEKLIVISIYLLLFFMGASIGRDPDIISNLPTLGLTALVISIGGISGSLLFACLIWKLFFRKKIYGHANES